MKEKQLLTADQYVVQKLIEAEERFTFLYNENDVIKDANKALAESFRTLLDAAMLLANSIKTKKSGEYISCSIVTKDGDEVFCAVFTEEELKPIFKALKVINNFNTKGTNDEEI